MIKKDKIVLSLSQPCW